MCIRVLGNKKIKLQKVEYSDINKFLVSIGIALIAISILISWLFFREPFDLLIKADDLENLTELGKEVIKERQEFLKNLLCLIPWISFIFFLLGLSSLIYGLIRWFKKQKLLDERDDLINRTMTKELEKLTDKEVVDKAETEYQSTETGDKEDEDQGTIPKSSKEQFIESYLNIEQTFSEKFNQFFSKSFRVLTNHRIKHFEYDIILNAPLSHDEDKIIEIKYYPSGANRQYILEALIRLEIATKQYQEFAKKPVKPVLFIVLPEDKYNSVEIANLKETPKQLKHIKFDNLSLHFIVKEKISEMSQGLLSSYIDR